MNTPKRRILAGAIALTLVAAACGSDDDTTDETSAPAETSATTDGDMTETTDGDMTETTDGDMVEVSGTLIGAGASSQAAAMQGWQAGFQAAQPRRRPSSTTRSARAADARRSCRAAPTSPAPTPR